MKATLLENGFYYIQHIQFEAFLFKKKKNDNSKTTE